MLKQVKTLDTPGTAFAAVSEFQEFLELDYDDLQ